MSFAESSQVSAASSKSFTATSHSVQMKNMPPMRVSTSTKIGADLMNNTSKEAKKRSLINKLKDTVNDCCLKIEEQIKLTLNSSEPDVIRLLLNDRFKNYFLQKTNNSLSDPLNQWIRNQECEDQLWNTISTNDGQQYQTQMSDNVNDDNREQTLTNGDAVIPDNIDSNLVQLENVEKEQMPSSTSQFSDAQQFCDCDSTSEDSSSRNTHINESISSSEPQSTLKSSNVIAMPSGQNTVAHSQKADAIAAVELKNMCNENSRPKLPNGKRNTDEANDNGNLEKKAKLSDTMDTLQHRSRSSRNKSSCRSSERLRSKGGKRM